MALQWNDIRANFNDVNSAMANAQGGISQAGTVFGELRKTILEEEQKAIENAYREKTFNENVRQFGLQYALDQDKLAEEIRAAQANEAHQAATLEESIRNNKVQEGLRRQEIANTAAYQQGVLNNNNRRLTLDEEQWKAKQDRIARDDEARRLTIDALNNVSRAKEKSVELEQSNTQLTDKLNSINSLSDSEFALKYPNQTKESVISDINEKLDINRAQLGFYKSTLNTNGNPIIIQSNADNLYRLLGGVNNETPTTPVWGIGIKQEEKLASDEEELRKKRKQFDIDFDNNLPKLIRDRYPNMSDKTVNDLAITIYTAYKNNPEVERYTTFNDIMNRVRYKENFFSEGGEYHLEDSNNISTNVNTDNTNNININKSNFDNLVKSFKEKPVENVDNLSKDAQDKLKRIRSQYLNVNRANKTYTSDEDAIKKADKDFLQFYNSKFKPSIASSDEIRILLSPFSDKELQVLGISRNTKTLSKHQLDLLEKYTGTTLGNIRYQRSLQY